MSFLRKKKTQGPILCPSPGKGSHRTLSLPMTRAGTGPYPVSFLKKKRTQGRILCLSPGNRGHRALSCVFLQDRDIGPCPRRENTQDRPSPAERGHRTLSCAMPRDREGTGSYPVSFPRTRRTQDPILCLSPGKRGHRALSCVFPQDRDIGLYPAPSPRAENPQNPIFPQQREDTGAIPALFSRRERGHMGPFLRPSPGGRGHRVFEK